MIAIPSTSARDAILAPVLNSVLETTECPAESNFSRFMTFNFLQATTMFVGLMFLTGGAANGVLIGMYEQASGLTISWSQWFLIMLVPTILMCVLVAVGSYLFSKPEEQYVKLCKDTSRIKAVYEELGTFTKEEKKVLIILLLSIVLWALGDVINLKTGYAAIFTMALLFVPGMHVVDPKAALGKINWSIVILVAGVMGFGGIFAECGLAESLSGVLFEPIMTPLYRSLGVLGVALGVMIVSLIAHVILPSPNNISLIAPILIAWGLGAGVSPAVLVSFLGLFILVNDKIVFMSYQQPPYFVLLGQANTGIGRFDKLLMKMWPYNAACMLIAGFIMYGIVCLTGFGI